MSIGEKRQRLFDIARGEYIAFVDDDDDISDDYVPRILKAIESSPDVVTFSQIATINGESGEIRFKLGHPTHEPWRPGGVAVRPPWHVCAWSRWLVAPCEFPPINYGEDAQWTQQANNLAKTSEHIDAVLHYYRHDSAWTEAPPPVERLFLT